MSFPTVQGRAVAGTPYREAQSCLGPAFANATYKFFLSGTSTPANVYQNGNLTTPFPATGVVSADNFGRFRPIYLDPSVIYKVQFFDSTNTLRWTRDPYYSQLSTVGTSSLSAVGFQIAPTGEITLDAPNAGGSGSTLTLKAGTLGITPLQLNGTLRGNSALIINSSVTTGAQTASFNANNKPGVPPGNLFNVTATAAPTGATYTGGNLTAPFTGATAGNYTVQLSTGQCIFGVTFTNGIVGFITPSTSISGTPTAALIVSTPVTPAGWLPITCDGVQYYTPVWHGSQPFVPLPAAPPAPVGETINASSVLFGGSGLTTATGGTATPGNWLVPITPGAGAGFWINVTKTGGLSGLAFSAAQGAWTNIGAGGLTISSNAQAQITGTYQISNSVTGSPVLASGTITLANNNGVQQPTYNGATPIVLGGDGTATLNGVSTSNWFAPTTANTGSGYWILISPTGGTAGYSFSAATGGYTNITNGGLTIGVNGTGAVTFSVSGTYIIASDSGGVNQLGSGNITLTGSNVQSNNYSGNTPLFLQGDGETQLNHAFTTSWYSPNSANVGANFWINVTRTGGTSGVNFTAAQGSWTNITNSGLTIDISGYAGVDVGTATASGTYQISSSSSGTPVLGSGTISLSITGLTITRTYTTGTSATDTVPPGTTTVDIFAWGAGASGDNTAAGTGAGDGGGGGGYVVSLGVSVTPGQLLTYTVGVGGAGVNLAPGNPGGNTTVTGTGISITAGGGNGGSVGGGGGTGGTASGGNNTNNAGAAGQSAGAGGNGGNNGNGTGGGNPGGSDPGGGSQGTVHGGIGGTSTRGGNGQVRFVYR